MDVSSEIKQLYKSDSTQKTLLVTFPDLDLTLDVANICADSMTLRESILESNSIEFVGCISSVFELQIYGIYEKLKGERIEVSIQADNTEPIPLFQGIVDSAKMQTNKRYKKITAYDVLYTKGNTEVSAWYNSLSFPITLRDLRNSLFSYIGITQAEIELPNDNISIKKQYDPKSLKALNVIKAICQINGAFGIINREGIFEYRILAESIVAATYPSTVLFPSTGLHPMNPTSQASSVAAAEIKAESFAYYKTVDYEEYEVKPVDKLTIRQNEDDKGVTYGSGTNNYIIQGNMFTYKLAKDVLAVIAENVYKNIQGISYHPFTSVNNGLPWIECGVDAVSYYVNDYYPGIERNTNEPAQKSFYVFSRELSGIQALRDSYNAEGEEYQTEFITDLQTQIDTIKQNISKDVDSKIEDYTYSKDEIDSMIIESGGGTVNIISVDVLPANPDSNTIYLIRGEVIVE